MSKPREPEQPDELDEEYQRWCEELAAEQRKGDCHGCGVCDRCIECNIAAAKAPPF